MELNNDQLLSYAKFIVYNSFYQESEIQTYTNKWRHRCQSMNNRTKVKEARELMTSHDSHIIFKIVSQTQLEVNTSEEKQF